VADLVVILASVEDALVALVVAGTVEEAVGSRRCL
jgi:hypothetical protein